MFLLPLSAVRRFATVRCLGLLAGFVLAATLSPAAQAQVTAPADTAFQRVLRKNQFSLTAQGSQFSGPGWERLQQDIRQTALVFIGEDHGVAQIPVFTQAVAQVLKPKLFVAEIDQYQAQDLNQLAAQPGLPTAFSRQHPMSLAFYSWQEEFELVQALRAQQTVVMGLDQVSAFSSGRFMELLAGQVKNKQTRAELLRRAAAYQAQDRRFMQTKTGNLAIYQSAAGLDSLRQLVRQEQPAVRQMLEQYLASAAIYRASSEGLPDSHAIRINLMKRNLLAGLRPYDQPGQALPNMLFKFGSYHLGRGRSIWGDMYDIGNLATSLADAHDQKSLHIFVMGKQGTMTGGFDLDDFAKNVMPYSRATEDMVVPFMAATPAGAAWQVFDVRPLRRAILYKGLKVANQDLEATILGYDYVVIIPETTASHNF